MPLISAFPCTICDTFPYDTAQELSDHLVSAHSTGTAPTSRVSPPQSTAPESGEVRSMAPGGTRAKGYTPEPMSPPQERYILSLFGKHPAEVVDITGFSKRDATALLDRLTKLPAPARPTTPATLAAPAPEFQHGKVYADADGAFIKVTESKGGNLYGKLLDDENRFTVYRPGLLRLIVRDITAEEAAAFGHAHHWCVFCGRNLSDEEENRSVEVGYGPTCAKKYGLPWG